MKDIINCSLDIKIDHLNTIIFSINFYLLRDNRFEKRNQKYENTTYR